MDRSKNPVIHRPISGQEYAALRIGAEGGIVVAAVWKCYSVTEVDAVPVLTPETERVISVPGSA